MYGIFSASHGGSSLLHAPGVPNVVDEFRLEPEKVIAQFTRK